MSAYSSAYKALSSAYSTQGKGIIVVSSLSPRVGAGCSTGLTQYDAAAQASTVLRLMREHCNIRNQLAFDSFFTPRSSITDRKAVMCRFYGIVVASAMRLDECYLEYVIDLVREWASGKEYRQHSEDWWMTRMARSRRTLTRIRNGRERGPGTRKRGGALSVAESLFKGGLGTMTKVYRECGII